MHYANENGLSGKNSTLQATSTSRNEVKLISTSNFLGREINVYGSAENPLFLAKDVAEWIEYSESNSSKLANLVDDDEKVRNIITTLGGKQEVWMLTEDGLYEVLMQSRKPIAKQFKKGVKEILKSIRKTGEFKSNQSKPGSVTPTKVRAGIEWVKGVSEMLNLNDASKLALLGKIADPLGLPLPDYTPSKGILKSATDLLKENGYPISAQIFNLKALEKGFICEMERNSSNGKRKKFKSITKAGLSYGENQVNPNNPKETQPLWYDRSFVELAGLLGLKR